MRPLLQLFLELFRISLFVVGGGYAIIAAADDAFARRGWTKEGELLDHLPVFQMVPGLIATHVAVYVGRRVAGALGAAVGVLAVALPSVVIFTFVAAGYDALPLDNAWLKSAFVGLRAGLTGIIAATVVRSWRRSLPDGFAYALCLCAFVALGVSVAVQWVILAAMAAGLVSVSACGGGSRRLCCSWLPLLFFLKYGALCFGGGFVLVPMYIEDFVGAAAPFLQIPEDEFANLMSLTQMTPGPIGVNGATYFGYRIAGVAGAVAASAALLLPGSVLVYLALSSLERFRASVVVRGILRGVRPASVALMLVALWGFAAMSVVAPGGGLNARAAAVVVLAFCAMLSRRVNVVAIVVMSALAGLALGA